MAHLVRVSVWLTYSKPACDAEVEEVSRLGCPLVCPGGLIRDNIGRQQVKVDVLQILTSSCWSVKHLVSEIHTSWGSWFNLRAGFFSFAQLSNPCSLRLLMQGLKHRTTFREQKNSEFCEMTHKIFTNNVWPKIGDEWNENSIINTWRPMLLCMKIVRK